MTRLLFASLVFVFLVVLARPVDAQEKQGDQPYYVVQEGDSLWDIALRFGVEIQDLQSSNGIPDPGQLSIGAALVIPGLDGFLGRLDTQIIPYGETLRTLGLRFRVPVETLARLNRLTGPAELYAGATLVIPFETKDNPIGLRASLAPGQSLLELAALRNSNPWSIAIGSGLPGSWAALPREALRIPGEVADRPGALAEAITSVTINPLLLSQGKTGVIEVSALPGLSLSGSLGGRELSFFELDGGYVSLLGIHAMIEPGLYPLTLKGAFPSGAEGDSLSFTFSQPVLIRSGDYAFDPVLRVDPETLDPAVTLPEDELWANLGVPVTRERMWAGLFQSPVPVELTNCWTSLFGNRRSYNGSAYTYFHSGLDFCGGEGQTSSRRPPEKSSSQVP